MSNCNCGDSNVGNTQRILSAFIQPGGAGPFSEVFPALAEGGSGSAWPGVKITGSQLNLRGARTPIRRRSSRTHQGVIAGYTQAAAADNTITLQFAVRGCAGFMAPELAACGLDLYQKHSCCGDGTVFEDDFALYTIWTGLNFESIQDSDQVTFDDAEDNPLTITMAASFNERFKIFPLKFGEIAQSAGLDTGSIVIHSAVYYDQERCANSLCGEKVGCAERWYAVTNEGKIIYRLNNRTPLAISAIAGYPASDFAEIALFRNRLFVSYTSGVGAGGYYYGELSADASPPSSWTAVSLSTNFTAKGWLNTGDNLYLYGIATASSISEIFDVNRDGSFEVAYLNQDVTLDINDMANCGSQIMAVADLGKIIFGSACNMALSALTSPTAENLYAVANQSLGRWWIGGATGVVFVTENDGVTWTSVSFGYTDGNIGDITWANANVGYLTWTAPAGGTDVWTTWNGGETWVKTGDRIPVQPVGEANISRVFVPCCNSPMEQVNNLLLTGSITGGAAGGIWEGTIQQC